MIARTITLNEINDFIIAELENIFVEKKTFKKTFKNHGYASQKSLNKKRKTEKNEKNRKTKKTKKNKKNKKN